MKRKKKLDKAFYHKAILALGVILVLFTLYNVFQTSSLSSTIEAKIAEAKEASRPAEIQLAVITDSGCSTCFDIQPKVDLIKQANVDITDEETLALSSARAKELIKKYGIEKIPAILLFGETKRVNVNGLKQVDDALIFTDVEPPYTDAKTGSVKGFVSSTLISDSSCKECIELDPLLDQIKQSGIKIASEKSLDIGSIKAQDIIDKYSIEAVPVLVLSKDMGAYTSDIVAGWSRIGTVEADGSYVTRLTVPPYVNLTSGEIRGNVTMTILSDKTCTACYDGSLFHKPILERMGVSIQEEKSFDIADAEGKELIDKYSITKVPALILEGDVGAYAFLVNAWKDVGTVEDGTYIFRQVEVAQQPYKDLSTGKVVQINSSSNSP